MSWRVFIEMAVLKMLLKETSLSKSIVAYLLHNLYLPWTRYRTVSNQIEKDNTEFKVAIIAVRTTKNESKLPE